MPLYNDLALLLFSKQIIRESLYNIVINYLRITSRLELYMQLTLRCVLL